MKLTKTQYKKLHGLTPIARTSMDIKLQIYVRNALYNREWLQMESTAKRIWKVAQSLYEIW